MAVRQAGRVIERGCEERDWLNVCMCVGLFMSVRLYSAINVRSSSGNLHLITSYRKSHMLPKERVN